MADVNLAITTRLTAHAGTNALISGRAWEDHLPQNPTLPACVVSVVSDNPGAHMMGVDADKNVARIQVDSIATTQAGAKALGLQVYAALSRWGASSGGTVVTHSLHENIVPAYEDDLQRWIEHRDFMVWYER